MCLAKSKIETGLVQKNDKICILPIGDTGTIKQITLFDQESTSMAAAGNVVLLQIHGIDVDRIRCVYLQQQ